jgi:hypothetical protein
LFSSSAQGSSAGVKEALVDIHGDLDDPAARTMLEALIVLVDFYQEASAERVYGAWAKLKARVLSLPDAGTPIRLFNCDARSLPLADGEVDFVVTLPPYINVFNYLDPGEFSCFPAF